MKWFRRREPIIQVEATPIDPILASEVERLTALVEQLRKDNEELLQENRFWRDCHNEAVRSKQELYDKYLLLVRAIELAKEIQFGGNFNEADPKV